MSNNSRFKFRVWDAKRNRFINEEKDNFTFPQDIIFDIFTGKFDGCSPSDIKRSNDLVLQQYTGLNDSSNKEIYEGDILSYGMGPLYEVLWDSIHAKWNFNTITNQDGMYHLSIGEVKKSEIIGNIFENESLVKHE